MSGKFLSDVSQEELSQNRVAAVLLDIDGTILGLDGKLVPGLRSELDRVRARGVSVSLASGRPYFTVRRIIDNLKISSPSMFDNGALIVDPQDGTTRSQICIEAVTAERCYQDLVQHGFHVELYDSADYYTAGRSAFAAIHEEYLLQPPSILAEPLRFIRERNILKIASIFQRSRTDEFVSLCGRFRDLNLVLNPLHAHPQVWIAIITDRHADRALLFDLFLEILGVSAEQTMCIGDGNSDLPFITRCGAGIAMGNAAPHIQQAARYITTSYDQGGVVLALKRLI